MAAVPGVRGTSTQELYGFSRTLSYDTHVQRFANATEQRFMYRPPLTRFSLPYSTLLAADKNSQITWFNSQKGMFDLTASITLNGTTYSNMTLLSDGFPVTNRAALLYDTKIELRQTQNAAFTWTAPVSPVFPTLSSGARAQYPFVQTSRFLTMLNDQETGMRYSEAFFGGGFTGFPTTALKEWTLSYPLITDADLATLETFFVSVGGRLVTFSFTDPIDGSVHPKVRFDNDEMTIQYITKNQNSTQFRLVETN